MTKRRICLGAIAGAHGVRGEFKVKTFTEAAENIAAYGPLESENGDLHFTISVIRELKEGLVLARAREVTTRDAAETLKGVRLYIDRDALPPPAEDEFYYEDLIGLAAQTEAGAPLGRVAAVHDFGAGDILELKEIPGRKAALMVRFSHETVPDIRLEEGLIVIASDALIEESPGNPEADEAFASSAMRAEDA